MRTDALNCGRENDLVSFLYGELNDLEANAYQLHLQECAACSKQVAGFASVRESLVTWRNESLGMSSPAKAIRARPSARAALREFFDLSPLWMKGAVAFAAVLFCVFAGLALAHLRDRQPNAVAATPPAGMNSPQEFNALVEKRVQDELKRIKSSDEELASAQQSSKDSSQRNPGKRVGNGSRQLALSATQNARRPLSKTEREQLAADLRLTSATESDLDLLDDRINQ